MFSPSYLLNIVLELLAKTVRQEKEIKEIWIGKKEIKPCLLADVILYLKDLKDST
jgi:hypothetical protein